MKGALDRRGHDAARIGVKARSVFAERIAFRREPLPELDLLQAQWQALEAQAQPSFFTSWHWIGTLLAAVPPTHRPMLLRGCLRGETVALALLGSAVVRRRRGLIRSPTIYLNEIGEPAYDLTIEHNGLLASRTHTADAIDCLIGWFADGIADASELRISGLVNRLPDEPLTSRGLAHWDVTSPYYFVDLRVLRSSRGELDPVLSRSARQQLRRAIRHYERIGELRLQPAMTSAEAHAFFTGMKELHIRSWERRGKPHSFSRPFFEQFHRLMIERNFADGCVELLRASAGSHVVGYLYNFRFGHRVYAYQSGLAYEDGARPGVVTHALAIRHAFVSGATIYDFLAGHNRLKQSLSTHCMPMFWQTVQQPRLAFRIEHIARRIKHWVKIRPSIGTAQEKCCWRKPKTIDDTPSLAHLVSGQTSAVRATVPDKRCQF